MALGRWGEIYRWNGAGSIRGVMEVGESFGLLTAV